MMASTSSSSANSQAKPFTFYRPKPAADAGFPVAPAKSVERAAAVPVKRGPKPVRPSQAVDITTTFADRQATREQSVLKKPVSSAFNTPIASAEDSIKTARIKGRTNSARSA
jgi:hypothetical protein